MLFVDNDQENVTSTIAVGIHGLDVDHKGIASFDFGQFGIAVILCPSQRRFDLFTILILQAIAAVGP